MGRGLLLLSVISLPLLASCQEDDAGESFAALAGLHFTDEEGESLLTSDLEGRVVLMNFMFTRCPAVCPRLTRLLAETRAALPKHLLDRVHFLSITVDPKGDSTSELKEFAQSASVDVPGWSFVRSTEDALDTLARRLTVFDPGGARVPSAHSTSIYLFDERGRPVQRYDGGATSARRLAQEVHSLCAQVASLP